MSGERWTCDGCGLYFYGPSVLYDIAELCHACDARKVLVEPDRTYEPDSDQDWPDEPEDAEDQDDCDQQGAWDNGIRALEGD